MSRLKEQYDHEIVEAMTKKFEYKNVMEVPEGVDQELLMKVLGNPEMAALLSALAKSMEKKEGK